MIQYIDNPLTITVENAEFTEYNNIHVTVRQRSVLIDIADPNVIDDTHLSVSLSQADSGRLTPGAAVEVQINWLDANGMRHATAVGTATVSQNLLKRVIGDV